MTESMLTTRLSSVITGCGANDTTCSRRSIMSRIRSTNGTTSVSPGDSVRLYRPSRSTTPARACGTIFTVRHNVSRTRKTTMAAAISGYMSAPSFVDERGRALDLHHFDLRAGLIHRVLRVRARRPFLAADLHAASPGIDPLEHDGLRPLERGGAGADGPRHRQVRLGDRPQ